MTNDGVARIRCGCKKGNFDRDVKDYRKQKSISHYENPKLIETFFDDEYPFYHYIFRVEKYSGSPVKGYYDRIYWQKLDEINCEGMSWIALQVYQKVSECAYCLIICDKKPEIDIFIQEYMSHDAGRMVSEILDSPASDNKDAYNMALRYYFSHLRARIGFWKK